MLKDFQKSERPSDEEIELRLEDVSSSFVHDAVKRGWRYASQICQFI